MNNDLYNWQSEQMVRHEMREVDRAVEQARLLREAGLAGESWLVRAMNALHTLLQARRKSVQEHQSIEHQVFQSVDHKSAP